MKVCIYGAGAIGGVVGARLALNGVETSVVARGPHLAAIRENGLTIVEPDGRRTVKVAASDNPADLGPQDYVIAGVKAHQLPAIADMMAPLLHEETAVSYAVNGIPWWYFHNEGSKWAEHRIEKLDPGGHLWDKIGVDRTIGCVVNLPAEIIEPGVVHWEGGANRLAFGETDGSKSSRLSALADAVQASGTETSIEHPIRYEVWNKLALILVSSPIAILTGAPPSASVGDPAVREVARKAGLESFAIAAAYGQKLDRDIDTILDRWSRAGNHRPSILQDFEAGKAIEIDPQVTVPLDMAHDAGVPVPTLDTVAGLMRARARNAGVHAA